MMIKHVEQLRGFNSYELGLMLRLQGCDADVAVIAAWWIMHNKAPKNWSKHMQTAIGKMTKFRIEEKKFPKFSEEVFKWIMKNYEDNKIKGKNQSLLLII